MRGTEATTSGTTASGFGASAQLYNYWQTCGEATHAHWAVVCQSAQRRAIVCAQDRFLVTQLAQAARSPRYHRLLSFFFFSLPLASFCFCWFLFVERSPACFIITRPGVGVRREHGVIFRLAVMYGACAFSCQGNHDFSKRVMVRRRLLPAPCTR